MMTIHEEPGPEPPQAPDASAAPEPPGARLRDLPAADLPRERLRRLGPQALSHAELLAILLRSGTRGASALEVARQILGRFGLQGLPRAHLEALCEVPGCGPAKAVQLLAAAELGRRLAVASPRERPRIGSPADAAALLRPEMAILEQEHLRVVLLSVRHHVMGVHEVYKGSVRASLVRVAEIFREPVRRNAPAILLAHNHPSGDPSPSAEDARVTQAVVEGGRLLDIEVLDHIVLARGGWVSMRERGLGFR